MNDLSRFISAIRRSAIEEKEKRNRLEELEDILEKDPLYSEFVEQQIQRVKVEIAACRQEMEVVTELLLRVPPWHDRHRSALQTFYGNGKYQTSVFVMTKFPEGNQDSDLKLKAVIDLVCAGLTAGGLHPRIANGAKYHSWLWDEVEIHLLGCASGVAIIEDKYRPELNPNVAMEWGWMKAMGKRVLYLQEEQFAHGRADLNGLRSWSFNWENPEPGITEALREWCGLVRQL
jgi:hypothetical protein